VVLPDPLPPLTRPATVDRLEGRLNILFICTWASDEPYLEVLRAAAMLDPEIRIYITGNSRGRERSFQGPLPPNVVLTGYVGEPEFQRLLFACDAVMDLTTRENCLLCGAYEATAAERPMVLSDTRCLRDYFDRGAVYADNTAAGIVAAVRELADNYSGLCRQIKQLRLERSEQWQESLQRLELALAAARRSR
jgi:glycosyltransferase involved in cell wall biosynthesis